MHRIPPSPSVRGNEASKFLHLQLFHCIWEKVMPVDVTNLTGTDTSSKASNSWCHSLHVFTTITTSIDKIYFASILNTNYWAALLTFTSPTSVMDKSETPGGTGVIVPSLDTRLHNIYKDIFHPPIPWSWSQLVVSNFVHMYWELRSPVSPGLGICYAVYSHIITPWDRSIRSSSADLADLRNGNQWISMASRVGDSKGSVSLTSSGMNPMVESRIHCRFLFMDSIAQSSQARMRYQ